MPLVSSQFHSVHYWLPKDNICQSQNYVNCIKCDTLRQVIKYQYLNNSLGEAWAVLETR